MVELLHQRRVIIVYYNIINVNNLAIVLSEYKIKKMKQARQKVYLISWLGIVNLFQTFEDLESVKDKQADTQAVRQLLDEDDNGQDKSEEVIC